MIKENTVSLSYTGKKVKRYWRKHAGDESREEIPIFSSEKKAKKINEENEKDEEQK